MKKTIRDINLTDKRIFLRVDYNVPIQNNTIKDDYRIKMSLPTIDYLLSQNVKSILIASHLGRPKEYDKKYSLFPVFDHLKYILKPKINLDFRHFYDEPAKYTLFENLRFLEEEESCSDLDNFQAYLAKHADLLVIDAFGVVHRKAASLTGTNLKAYAGLLVQRELEVLQLLDTRFDIIILGGAKVDDKILLVKNCIKKCKKIYIGGGMCKPFINGTLSDLITEIKEIASEYGTEIILPIDYVVKNGDEYLNTDGFRNDFVDIGSESVKVLVDEINNAKSVFWNGPVGIFEIEGSSRGTQAVVKALKNVETSIIGGGDTASAVAKFGKLNEYTHVSTGGGSLLALIEGQKLPGIEIIED